MPNPYAPPDPNAPPPPERKGPDRDEVRRRREQSQREAGKSNDAGADPHPNQLPTPEQAKEFMRATVPFAVMMLCGMLALRWPFPWHIAGAGMLAVAVFLGIRAIMVRRRINRAVFPVFLMVSVALAVVLMLSSLAPLTLWQAHQERQECIDQALTLRAERECQTVYDEAVQERFTTG